MHKIIIPVDKLQIPNHLSMFQLFNQRCTYDYKSSSKNDWEYCFCTCFKPMITNTPFWWWKWGKFRLFPYSTWTELTSGLRSVDWSENETGCTWDINIFIVYVYFNFAWYKTWHALIGICFFFMYIYVYIQNFEYKEIFV